MPDRSRARPGRIRGAPRRLPAGLLLPVALLFFGPACDTGTPSSIPPGDDREGPTYDEEGTWTEMADLPLPVFDAAGAPFGSAIYVVGGLTADGTATSAVQRYDPGADAWTRLGDLPTALSQSSLVVHDDALFLLGGNRGTATDPVPRAEVYRYDPDADAWREHSLLPDRRDEHGSASIGGRIVVFGGGAFAPPPGDSIAVYDEDGWRYGPPPPHATGRVDVHGVSGGALLALEQRSSAALDVLDGDAVTWSSVISTPVSEPPRAGATWNGRLHVLAYSGPERFHRVFEPGTGSWLRLPPLEETLRNASVVAFDDRLYVIGGRDRDGAVTGRVAAFSQP